MFKVEAKTNEGLEILLQDALSRNNYLCWGVGTYRDKKKHDPCNATERMNDVDFVLGRVAKLYGLRRDKFRYFLKDETSPDGYGHTHLLLEEPSERTEMIWPVQETIPREIEREWRKHFGRCDFELFNNGDSPNYEEKKKGLRYICKTKQKGVNVLNDFRFSRGLRRGIGWKYDNHVHSSEPNRRELFFDDVL